MSAHPDLYSMAAAKTLTNSTHVRDGHKILSYQRAADGVILRVGQALQPKPPKRLTWGPACVVVNGLAIGSLASASVILVIDHHAGWWFPAVTVVPAVAALVWLQMVAHTISQQLTSLRVRYKIETGRDA